ncbi:MAG: tetratricopeptide repeat protein [Burkholderiaceae bacterium]|nr:tetratricopeptide repeat protein [Burkholderiaceae bacterium]
MATQLDLQEQEQLDQLKTLWKQYGNLLTWLLIAALSAYAAWNGWNWWQRQQSTKAAAMYDELEKAARAGDVDKTGRVFTDLKERFPRTVFSEQAALLAAKLQFDSGKLDQARATLAWVSENAIEAEYQTIARLRLAGVLLDEKKYDEALKQLDAATAKEFEALVADRRGDVLLAQGKNTQAQAAYRTAWKAMDATVPYRQLIEAKLTAMGAAPKAEKSEAPAKEATP